MLWLSGTGCKAQKQAMQRFVEHRGFYYKLIRERRECVSVQAAGNSIRCDLGRD